ncbi:metallophosphoesterase [Hymenobacter sp. BT491]|nr:metallophosphoesterase [Hymenobacter sp. BT491]
MRLFSTRLFLLSMAVVLAASGCNLLEYSPNQAYVPAAERHLTAQNLRRLQQQPLSPTDTLRFVFIGDSQRFYDEADDFVASVNEQQDIDFVMLAGDISDFGLVREMRWMHRRLQRLRVPYLTVIGNHDQVGNGRNAYQTVFGPLNYSFVRGGTKFICVDTNGREYGFQGRVPDVSWLTQQLADTAGAQRSVVVCHVPPTDADFDPQLVQPYARTVRSSPQLVLHLAGHTHRYTAGQPFRDGITYLTTYNFEKGRYHIVSVWGRRQFRLETVQYASQN